MTTLRLQFIQELVLRGLAERTQEAYIHQVYHLAKHYRRSPDTLTEEEVHAYLIHLAMERHLAASSINQAVNAFRFFINMWPIGIWRSCARPSPLGASRLSGHRSSASNNWK